MRIIYALLSVLVLAACSNYSEEVTKTGEITKITGEMVYIDDLPLKVEDTSELEVGQNVKVTFIDTTSAESWDPDDFEVKNIEILK
ncbi:hypothetical protein NC797_11675 [Aquibacillus sp. 3ASR75-11]|uniref:DUF3221 domain-containing protein n=1 Tax=Terrihalobacillus insolitus TaxID=2950438 RepID=A0A9X3WV62_9BACI|nr:hypothetical protein [Terrihalobacillus insolitus]MDC3413177.1 hypothetical protein [Terrihalobacillus insolitus]MDC3425163.1 hypothetical protein [Terrihalobacillus insolitus]